MSDQRFKQMWKALGVFIFFFLMQLAVSMAAGALAAWQLRGLGMTAAAVDAAVLEQVKAWNAYLLLIADGLTVLALLLWGRFKERQPMMDYTALRRPLGGRGALLCVALGAAANFWFALAVNLIPWPAAWLEEYAASVSTLSGADVLTVAAVVLAAPCCEELVFRGRIYGELAVTIPAGAAVMLQAILFGGMHDGMIWMIYAFVLGCVLGYVRKLTGTLRATLLVHMAFNGASYLFDWFAGRWGEQGGAVTGALLGSAVLFIICIFRLNSLYRKEEQV